MHGTGAMMMWGWFVATDHKLQSRALKWGVKRQEVESEKMELGSGNGDPVQVTW